MIAAAPDDPPILLRPAQADDALCLSVLATQVFLDTYATEGIRPSLAREVLSSYSAASFSAALGESRTRLLAAAESQAVLGGATVLWLTPWVHNHRALAFYQARGYQDFGLTSFVFEGESHDNRLVAKSLAVPSAASRTDVTPPA